MTDTQQTLLFKEIFKTEEVEKTRSSTKQHFLIGRTDLAHNPVFINCKPLDNLIITLAELFSHQHSVVSLASWKAYKLYQQKDVRSLSTDIELLMKLNPAYMKMEDMQVLLLPEHQDHLKRPTQGTLKYKPYTAFCGCAANAVPHVPVPHIPASNLISPIATSTPAETPFQFFNPGSTPILQSGPPIPKSTPPPDTTTPITPTLCLSCTSDLSPNQLPFEMLDLWHTNHKG
ncbi:hypothetical protein BDR06DRAFT_1015729 [Suillus hirtellus]|nr:hypothetical protein BDR06DRAFT_1015729 [Suillus hirtellus]